MELTDPSDLQANDPRWSSSAKATQQSSAAWNAGDVAAVIQFMPGKTTARLPRPLSDAYCNRSDRVTLL